MSSLETDLSFGGKKRPAWAGKVTIKWETIQHLHFGAFERVTEVIGLVAPGATSGAVGPGVDLRHADQHGQERAREVPV